MTDSTRDPCTLQLERCVIEVGVDLLRFDDAGRALFDRAGFTAAFEGRLRMRTLDS